jgi:hypothetical protein
MLAHATVAVLIANIVGLIVVATAYTRACSLLPFAPTSSFRYAICDFVTAASCFAGRFPVFDLLRGHRLSAALAAR